MDEDIRNLLFDDNRDYSSDEIEDDDYRLSHDHGEIEELTTDFVLSDEENNSFQNATEQGPAMSESASTNFTSRNKSETWTNVPGVASAGRLGIHNIVRERSGPTNYANRSVDDIASDFFLFFRDSLLQEICTYTNIEGNYRPKEKWKPINITEPKKFFGTLQLIRVQKSKGKLVFQL